ncbi:TPA: lipopolysaccharide transport periplasmic protein LptA [Serratia marcescens]|nr:lipopolysaccharide transport periplasmic protein LptA [Serratia marcescens]
MTKRHLLLLTCILPSVLYGAGNRSKGYTINSDKQLVLANGDVQAIGNVHIVNGDMVIDAERATYHQADPNNIFITANGAPITYRGKLEDGSPFTGRSKHLRYVIKKSTLTLSGDAFVRNNNNTLAAARIDYNINTKKLVASGQPGRRVTSIIYPDAIPEKNNLQ